MAEKKLINISRINNVETGSDYITMDYLYAPCLNSTSHFSDPQSVTVGAADPLTVDLTHLRDLHWLRSNHSISDSFATVAHPSATLSGPGAHALPSAFHGTYFLLDPRKRL